MKPTALLSFTAFLATIPASNWMIEHVGVCIGQGPCLLPVFPGIMAPSAVALIGFALVLRDHVHQVIGANAALLAIVIGSALSVLFSSPSLALAAAVAFFISESADLLVYAPLRLRWPSFAILVSGVVGAVIDSVFFLLLAFGDLSFLLGQSIGKIWASLIAAAFLRAALLYRQRVAA